MTKSPTIATVCSHSSLQIFYGAKKEGLRTLGICLKEVPKFYDAFPLAKPDEFIVLDSYLDLLKPEIEEELIQKNAVIIPHGSFVEYMGAKNFQKLKVPVYGNKKVLDWESDREIERSWLEGARILMPKEIKEPKEITGPVIVKYHGAKGGRGFFIAKSKADFDKNVDRTEKFTIQEFIPGTRFYFHFFFSPLMSKEEGYALPSRKGCLQLLGMDRRVESDIDEISKLGSPKELAEAGITPGFTVTGNVELVLRESLLPKVLDMGARAVDKSFELFGGLWGPFCLECIIDKDLNIYAFEISARIVAGTNVSIPSSPYSELIEPNLTTGGRIAQEVKRAFKEKRTGEVLT